MRISKIVIGLTLTSALSASALAASPNWRFAEGGYTNADAGRFDFDGIEVGATYLLDSNIYITGNYSALEDGSADLDMFTLGAGYRMPINSYTDGYFGLNYEHLDGDVSDDGGYSLNAGVRSMITDQVELLGEVGYYDVYDGDVTVKVGANYYFSPNWAAGFSYEKIDDFDITQLNARYTF